MSATSATFRREALKSATVTETPKPELAAPLDPKPTSPAPASSATMEKVVSSTTAPAASGVRLATTSVCERVGSARGIAASIGRKDMNHEFIPWLSDRLGKRALIEHGARQNDATITPTNAH